MSTRLTNQFAESRYRVAFVIFGILMTIGSYLTNYTVAAGFFAVVAVVVLVSVVQQMEM